MSLTVQPHPDLVYEDQKTLGVIAGQTFSEITPRYGEIFGPQSVIRLELPSQAWLDPTAGYFSFKTSIIAGANNLSIDPSVPNSFRRNDRSVAYPNYGVNFPDQGVVFKPGIQCIFDRIRVLAGTTVLEDIQDYNILHRIMLESVSTKLWRDTEGDLYEGVYDPANKKQYYKNMDYHALLPNDENTTNTDGHEYIVRPLVGILNAGKYLPLKYMPQLTFEFYMAHQNDCLWSTTNYIHPTTGTVAERALVPLNHIANSHRQPHKNNTAIINSHTAVVNDTPADFPNATYTVKDFKYHAHFIHPIKDYDAAVGRQIESSGLDLYHSSWRVHTRNLESVGKLTVSIQERAESLKSILAVMRNGATINDNRFDFSFAANGIETYQWKIGSENLPTVPINCVNGGGPALMQLQKTLRTFGNKLGTGYLSEESFLPSDLPHQIDSCSPYELTRQTGEPSKFIMALDLERSPGQMSGYDSSTSSVDIELEMTLRSHYNIVGDKISLRGSAPGTVWQPSKYRVGIPSQTHTLFEKDGVVLANMEFDPMVKAPFLRYFHLPSTAIGDVDLDSRSGFFPDDRYMGAMCTKNLVHSNYSLASLSSTIASTTHSSVAEITAGARTAGDTYATWDAAQTARSHAQGIPAIANNGNIYYVKMESAGTVMKLYYMSGLSTDAITTLTSVRYDYDGANHTVTLTNADNYSRLYAFAHVDQVLRLTNIGRIQIVR